MCGAERTFIKGKKNIFLQNMLDDYKKLSVMNLLTLFPGLQNNVHLEQLIDPSYFCLNCMESLFSVKFAFDQMNNLKNSLKAMRTNVLKRFQTNLIGQQVHPTQRANSNQLLLPVDFKAILLSITKGSFHKIVCFSMNFIKQII